MEDYLFKYQRGNSFDLPTLFNDDYFKAIKLLWNNKHYVSAMKLLMSAVDTFGYLEYGDKPGTFRAWLTEYADLSQLGVSADELWELRNSLLHMTNLDSRRVASGKIRRLMFYVGHLPADHPNSNEEAKYLGMWQLIQCVAHAMGAYCNSFNLNPAKFGEFAERYDRVISDVRHLEIEV
jgi:hypothetical protein